MNDWESLKLPFFENMAHRVNEVTLGYQDAPFIYATTPFDENGDPWSDTWGVCVYFIITGFHQVISDTTNYPDPVMNIEDVNLWDNSTRNTVPETTWRIIGVESILDPYLGWTKTMSKLSLVEKHLTPTTYLHEWGHCYTPDPDPYYENTRPNYNTSGIYDWPNSDYSWVYRTPHYGHYIDPGSGLFWNLYRAHYYLNIMHWEIGIGYDGDWCWKHDKFPYYYWTWYDSLRWDDNY